MDEAKAANKPLDQLLELYDSLIAAFNEAKGYVRHSISGGRSSQRNASSTESPMNAHFYAPDEPISLDASVKMFSSATC